MGGSYVHSLSIIGGILLSVVGIVFSPSILRLMKTPPEVLDTSVLYFRIYFLGSLFNLLYNMGPVSCRRWETPGGLLYSCAFLLLPILSLISFL